MHVHQAANVIPHCTKYDPYQVDPLPNACASHTPQFSDYLVTIAEGTDPAVIAALLNGHMLVHSQAKRAKPTPVRRPEISAGGTTEGWHYFLTRWRAYSLAVHLAGAEIPIQLLECLDPKLRRDVTRNMVGPTPVEEHTEEELLAAIKALAVREENPKVARVALSRMVQDRGEPIRSFAARLRGQAEVCMFTMKCAGCDVVNNQGEQRVADQLCVGLADPDIQEDLLKDPNQHMTVEETIRFVEVRAAGKRSAVTITTPTSSSTSANEEIDLEDAILSGYKKQQRPQSKATPPNRRHMHGTNPHLANGSSHPSHLQTQRLAAASVGSRGMARGRGLLLGGTNARHTAQSAHHAAGRTITPSTVGKVLSKRAPYRKPSHYPTRLGIPRKAPGWNADPPHSPTLT